ncbi:transglutaminase domain-containing protein [Peptoclostridium acidaminophilum]|nr:transglutaminase domain-containing protein [Peptoclostridium acidaminophilum]
MVTAIFSSLSYAQEQGIFEKAEAEYINRIYKDLPAAPAKADMRSLESVTYVSSLEELEAMLYDAMTERRPRFEAVYTGGTSNMLADMRAAFENAIASDDYLGFSYTSIRYGYSGYPGNYSIYYELTYLTTKEQEDYVDSRVDDILLEIVSPGMTSFEKELAIHDYIVKNVEYDTSYEEHSAYAALAYGKTVCQGYSLLAYKMLEEAGVQARIVAGDESMNHAWNMANIDGEWYHSDLTWDDPLPDVKSRTIYTYFNLSDERMSQDHFWDETAYPDCTSEKYSYMNEVTYPVTMDGKLYYSNSSIDNKLYSMLLDGSGKQLICPDRSLFLCGYGDWIYFSNYSRGGYIYRTSTDGSSTEMINDVHSTYLSIDGNELAFMNESTDETEVIYLEPLAPQSIELDKDSLRITKGGSISVGCGIYPAGASGDIIWTSSDTEVAQVDSSGNITALSGGICILRATVEGTEISDECTVIVEDPAESSEAEVIDYKTEIDPNKKWTVEFSSALSKEIGIPGLAQVTQGDLDSGACAVFGENDNKIEVIPPAEGYIKGKSYRLCISKDVSSSEGVSLEKPVVLYFVVD